jgi:hypothetical protein
MMLPNINQQAQGLNVQPPRVPSGNQMMGAASQARGNMPARPVQSMAPDNGQHGGAQRALTPTSGAMNMSNQIQANPYGNQNRVYPGQQRQINNPLPQGLQTPNVQPPNPQFQQQVQPPTMGVMPNMFQTQLPQQVTHQAPPQQRQMPYNQALQQRMMGRGMPPVFGGGGI